MPEDKDRENERKKEWKLRHPEKQKEYRKKYERVHREEIRQRQNEWRKANIELRKIQHAAQERAKENIPLKDKCEQCGGRATERHHPDYSKPLEVMHLCHSCHVKMNRIRRVQPPKEVKG